MYPITNVTIASNAIDKVIRVSTEALGLNLGKITIPPIIAPTPYDPNNSPKPVESSPSSCFAISGKRDNKALLHNANKPARKINTCAAWEWRIYLI
jgi:hypothetical protein